MTTAEEKTIDAGPQALTPQIPVGQGVQGAPGWIALTSRPTSVRADRPVRSRRVYQQVGALTAIVVVAVGLLGSVASRHLAEREGVNDASQRAQTLADAVVQPALADGLLEGDPASVERLDAAVRAHMLGSSIVRVKFWTADGTIVYSDESRLIGRQFPLGQDERDVFVTPALRAEVSDLQAPENTYERGQGKLLEVYRPVQTPGGRTLLFETYSPYSVVTARTGEIWRGFAGITFSSLLVLVVLLLPLLWRLLDRLGRAQTQRELLLERAVEASGTERRRIAATLHDGVVQELAATSFAVSGAARQAEASGQEALARSLSGAAETVRTSIGGLRALLIDIYPPSLEQTGLRATLEDLAASLRTRDVVVTVQVADQPSRLDRVTQRLVFRVAQECLRNAARHAQANAVTVRLDERGETATLEVIDDGIGFHAETALSDPAEGHFGLRLISDAVAEGGGELWLRTGPGLGTSWRMTVPITDPEQAG